MALFLATPASDRSSMVTEAYVGLQNGKTLTFSLSSVQAAEGSIIDLRHPSQTLSPCGGKPPAYIGTMSF